MNEKETKRVLKSNISTSAVINSINWLLFDVCVLRNWQFFLRSTIIVRHLTPERSKYIYMKRCLSIVESMMINDHYFQLHSNANWRSVSAQLISIHSDWQCHVFFSFLSLSLLSFWFRFSVYRNNRMFSSSSFYTQGTYINRVDASRFEERALSVYARVCLYTKLKILLLVMVTCWAKNSFDLRCIVTIFKLNEQHAHRLCIARVYLNISVCLNWRVFFFFFRRLLNQSDQ